jgi:glycosyltransferase involved in cell wall biosynthesis
VRILIIAGTLNNIEAGPYWSIHGLVSGLLKKGVKITLVGSIDNKYLLSSTNIYLKLQKEFSNFELKMFRKYGFGNADIIPGLLPFLLKKHDFDLILIQGPWILSGWISFIYAKLSSIPVVITLRGEFMNFGSVRKLIKRPFLPLVKFMLNNVSVIHFLNPKEQRVLKYMGITSANVVIPNGIQMEKHAPALLSNKFIYIGRLTPGKNILNLINGWKLAEVKSHQLLIAGTGEPNYMAEINKAIGNSSNIILVGKLDGIEKVNFMSNASWFILPSYREGMPMAALEAMSFGVGCILSKECNLEDFVNNGAAILTGLKEQDIKNAIQKAVNLTKFEKEIMVRKSEELIEDVYTWSVISDKFMEMIMNLKNIK